jgi:hypothetical protein
MSIPELSFATSEPGEKQGKRELDKTGSPSLYSSKTVSRILPR